MKRIIKGKLYDEETAEYIGGWLSDDGRAGATLYRKANGEYFVVKIGNHHGFKGDYQGKEIYRMAEKDCRINACAECSLFNKCVWQHPKDWAEDNIDAEDFILAFGPVEE